MNNKLINKYLKYRLSVIVTALTCLLVSFIVLWICNIPITAFILMASLIVIIGMVLALIDYRNFNKKHTLLKKAELVPEVLTDSLEPSEDEEDGIDNAINLIEEDYLKIIMTLTNRLNATKAKTTSSMEAMTDYYTMWVHQVKTPIAAMSLIVQGMEDEDTSLRLRSELTRIESYSSMALNYIRLSGETNDLSFSTFKMDDAARETVKKLMSMFVAKGLSVDFKPSGATIVSDYKWVTFMLEQIISNSIKYTNKGSIKIYGTSNSITIEDEGIGIAKEDLPRITEKGYTGYNGHNEKHSTGLGLYLVQKTADMLNITINIESELTKGTKVTLTWGS